MNRQTLLRDNAIMADFISSIHEIVGQSNPRKMSSVALRREHERFSQILADGVIDDVICGAMTDEPYDNFIMTSNLSEETKSAIARKIAEGLVQETVGVE